MSVGLVLICSVMIVGTVGLEAVDFESSCSITCCVLSVMVEADKKPSFGGGGGGGCAKTGRQAAFGPVPIETPLVDEFSEDLSCCLELELPMLD